MTIIKNFFRLNDLDSNFLEDLVESGKRIFGEDVLRSIESCIQCGCCSGSCPVSHEMDYTPRQLVRMIQLGLKQEVLNSNTIWICLSCFSCTVRCPRGIHIAELMEALKPLAIEYGVSNKYARFDQVFSDVIRKKGRSSEYLLLS
ncbi:MAG TPA: 4Fe-4S dicluster domain-containing protein, partial [Candidatus Methanoperedens sp.]